MPFLKDKSKLQSRTNRLESLTKKNGYRCAVYNVPLDRYSGEFTDNVKHGRGNLLTRTFRLYEGSWDKNFRHGFGVFSFRNENKVFILKYRGNWKKGKESGFGAMHYPDDAYFLGNFKNGKRHGYGQMWYANGGFYDGDWFKDMRHGLGMYVRPDGNRYEGAWAYDQKHGKGRFFHLDSGQMQDGVWQQDICVYSYFVDIPFRQTAVDPTPYPIQVVELVNVQEICNEQELKALAGNIRSCLKFSEASLLSNDTRSNIYPYQTESYKRI